MATFTPVALIDETNPLGPPADPDNNTPINNATWLAMQNNLSDYVVAALSDLQATTQPLDDDLTSIAALSTSSFGRSLLTQASNSAARTTLGLAIGTDVQAFDADLTSIAALSTTSFGRSLLTQADAPTARTTLGVTIGTNVQAHDADLDSIAALSTTSFGRSLLTQADASTARSTLGVAIGTNVQAFDSDLASIAALSTASFGRSLLTQADAASARSTLGVGVGADVQPHDSDLDAIAALSTTSFGRSLLTQASAEAARDTLGINFWFNAVTDFNMVGDNSHDNGIAFIAAINALNATTGGAALYIPPGVYIISGTLPALTASDILIFGAGPATRLKYKSTAARGTFFTVGTGPTDDLPQGQSASHISIRSLALQCNAASNTPPASEKAFHLVRGGTIFIDDILCLDIGGLCEIGTADSYDDGSGTDYNNRVQLYGFSNVRGNWNSITSEPSRVHIVNGTDGRYTDIRLTDSGVNGGYGIHADPTPKGVDQHFFTRCEIWGEGAHSENVGHLLVGPDNSTVTGGIDWNVYLDFSVGTIYNWVFHQCVFDEGVSGSAYLYSSGGSKQCKSVHFLDTHMAVAGKDTNTGGGNGIRINHNGTGTLNDLKVIGGRIRVKNAPALKFNGGGHVDSVSISSVELMQESVASTGTNATRKSIIHDHWHGLNPNDGIVFSTSPDAALTVGTTYYVKNADANGDGLEFSLSLTPGGTAISLSTSSNVGSYMAKIDQLALIQDILGLRMTGNYFGPFEGGTGGTQVTYAIQDTGTVTSHYTVTGNVARGMLNASPYNIANSGTGKIVANNAT